MVLNCLLYALGFDTDIELGRGGTAVLQEALYQCNIVAVGFIYLRGVPLPEAMGTDSVILKIVTHDFKLLLDGSLREGEDSLIALDTIAQSVVLDVLLEYQRYGENSALAGLLLHDLQPEAVAVPYNIALPQLQDIADAQAQVCFQHKGGGDALIGAAAAKAGLHIVDNLLVLRLRQSLGLLVHSCLQ